MSTCRFIYFDLRLSGASILVSYMMKFKAVASSSSSFSATFLAIDSLCVILFVRDVELSQSVLSCDFSSSPVMLVWNKNCMCCINFKNEYYSSCRSCCTVI